jgi:hypothetical protein
MAAIKNMTSANVWNLVCTDCTDASASQHLLLTMLCAELILQLGSTHIKPSTATSAMQHSNNAKDLAGKKRRAMYASIKRRMKNAPVDVVAAWSAAQGSNSQKLEFLKKFAEDPTMQNMAMTIGQKQSRISGALCKTAAATAAATATTTAAAAAVACSRQQQQQQAAAAAANNRPTLH